MGLDVKKILGTSISGVRTRGEVPVLRTNLYASNPNLQARLASYDTIKTYQAGDPYNVHDYLGDDVVGVKYDRFA